MDGPWYLLKLLAIAMAAYIVALGGLIAVFHWLFGGDTASETDTDTETETDTS